MDRREEELIRWRDRLAECLRDDPDKHVGRRNPALASIPDTFPNPAVVDAYIHPRTTRIEDLPHRSAYTFTTRRPTINVVELARLCELSFYWGSPSVILERFKSRLWPAVLLRNVIGDTLALLRDGRNVPVEVCLFDQGFSDMLMFMQERSYTMYGKPTRYDKEREQYKLLFKARPFAERTLGALRDLNADKPGKWPKIEDTMIIRIPHAIALLLTRYVFIGEPWSAVLTSAS